MQKAFARHSDGEQPLPRNFAADRARGERACGRQKVRGFPIGQERIIVAQATLPIFIRLGCRSAVERGILGGRHRGTCFLGLLACSSHCFRLLNRLHQNGLIWPENMPFWLSDNIFSTFWTFKGQKITTFEGAVKRKKQPSEDVQLSELKPGLARPIAAYMRTGKPVRITAANGEVLALFMPREKFEGDLTRAFPITADKFRKRRTRVAHATFFGQPFLIRQREGDEYVLVPPTEYKDEINPIAIEQQTRRALFGQFPSAPEDLTSIRTEIGQIAGKLDAVLEALTQTGFPRSHGQGKTDPQLAFAKELGRLEERLRQIEANRTRTDKGP